MLYRVIITRKYQLFVYNPPMHVLIDGKKQCSIQNGGKLDLLLEGGNHIVDIKSLFRSRRIEFVLQRDLSLNLKWDRVSGRILAELNKE